MLETEAQQQREATESALQSLDLFKTRYEGGVDTYLQVITSQTAALQNQQNDIDITRRRLEASVLLIKVLGGGWDVSQLPQLQGRIRVCLSIYSGQDESFVSCCFIQAKTGERVSSPLWITGNCRLVFRDHQ